MTRQITLELCLDNNPRETCRLPAPEAATLLHRRMARRWRWRIEPPDLTGELVDDEARYAADCAACGVANPFAV